MRWYQAAKKHVRAVGENPFGFQTQTPAPAPGQRSGPVPPPAGGPRPPGGPSVPSRTTEKDLTKFEDRDQYMRSIMRQIKNMDAGKLATLADAMGQDAFWQNLSVSPPVETAEMPQAAPTPAPGGQMPAQTEIQAPGPKRLVPQPPPARGTPEAWRNQQDKLNYEQRLKGFEDKPRKPPGAHFE